MEFVPFEGDLDKEPTAFVPFSGKLDEPAAPAKGGKGNNNKVLSADLPLGIAETLTTGLLNAVGGVGAKAAGGLYGAIAPGTTAKEAADQATQWYGENVSPVLQAQTE